MIWIIISLLFCLFQPMGAHELWQLVHYYYGDELGLNSSDEDYMVPSPDDLQKIHENDVGLSDDFCGKVGRVPSSLGRASQLSRRGPATHSVDVLGPVAQRVDSLSIG